MARHALRPDHRARTAAGALLLAGASALAAPGIATAGEAPASDSGSGGGDQCEGLRLQLSALAEQVADATIGDLPSLISERASLQGDLDACLEL